jgi:transmembrane sensor
MPAIDCAMPTSDTRQLDPAVVDQAIQWLIKLRFNQADAATAQAFDRWLGQSPEHARAWQRVATLNDDFARLPPTIARHTLNNANHQLRRRDSLKLLGLLAAAGGLSWLGHERGTLPGLLAEHRTATGERRAIDLADGSRIQLNSDSAIDTRFDERRRLIVLRHGEILIDTGADPEATPARPLWVQTPHGYLRALGTSFLVREQHDSTLLAVRQGAVAIFPDDRAALATHIVRPGERVLFNARGPSAAPNNGLDPWAWSDGVISAHDMRLGDFIAELARHRRGVLRCSDTSANLRLSGTYQLADTDQVLALIAQTLPVRIDYRTRYWVTLTASS